MEINLQPEWFRGLNAEAAIADARQTAENRSILNLPCFAIFSCRGSRLSAVEKDIHFDEKTDSARSRAPPKYYKCIIWAIDTDYVVTEKQRERLRHLLDPGVQGDTLAIQLAQKHCRMYVQFF